MIDKSVFKNGIVQYTYFDDTSFSPLGVFWVNFTKGQNNKIIALGLNLMVAYWARKQGIGSKLMQEVINDSNIVLSPSGSEEGGMALLNKFKFKYNKDIDMLVFSKEV